MQHRTVFLNCANIDYELDAVLKRLAVPGIDDFPFEVRASIADNTEQYKLQPLRLQLETEWQRQLIDRRNANSQAHTLSQTERQRREHEMFTAVLVDFLPRAHKLGQLEARIARLRGAALPMPHAASVETGLDALAAGNVTLALGLWAGLDAPEQVAEEVQAQRDQRAEWLLQSAYRACDGLYAQANTATRAASAATIRSGYIEPILRIGTEAQREKAQWISIELEAAINNTPRHVSTASAASGRAGLRAAAPVRTSAIAPRWRWTAVALVLILAGIGARVVFTQMIGPFSANAQGETREAGVAGNLGRSTADSQGATVAPAAGNSAPAAGAVARIIAPTQAYVAAAPIDFMIWGTRLDQVATAQLVTTGGKPIMLEYKASGADQAIVRLTQATAIPNGEATYVLRLDGKNQAAVAVTLRDYKARVEVKGVNEAYSDRSRIERDAAGLYTQLRPKPAQKQAFIGVLRNGDQVDILRDDRAGWYQVRIYASSDPGQVGTVGWIEANLIDG